MPWAGKNLLFLTCKFCSNLSCTLILLLHLQWAPLALWPSAFVSFYSINYLTLAKLSRNSRINFINFDCDPKNTLQLACCNSCHVVTSQCHNSCHVMSWVTVTWLWHCTYVTIPESGLRRHGEANFLCERHKVLYIELHLSCLCGVLILKAHLKSCSSV